GDVFMGIATATGKGRIALDKREEQASARCDQESLIDRSLSSKKLSGNDEFFEYESSPLRIPPWSFPRRLQCPLVPRPSDRVWERGRVENACLRVFRT